jgi:membrane protein implicated in regulation of membrane protease activity
MKPGAIAGITVGIGVFVIFGIVLLLYLWRRRKQRKQRFEHLDISEMEGSSRGLERFVGGKWRAKTDGTSEPVETGSRRVRVIPGPSVELDGTQADRG